MSSPARLNLFEGYGVELEYMIVDRQTLNVQPICDRLIHDVVQRYDAEIEMGELCWSNELPLHVVELKTNGPVKSLDGLDALFQRHVADVNARLEPHGAQLMPTATHPWMDPFAEMKLWPHEYSPVYEAFNRIFDCRGHGWANLQSVHLNLSFNGDAQFARLHAAIRLILPILPALAASSPIMDGRTTAHRDHRLEVYRHNARRVPQVSGRVIPEPLFTAAAYDEGIFQPLYRAIAPYDPDQILQEEWLNARGAIARFDRGAIEIRVLDIQECPRADLAILRAVCAVIGALIDQRWIGLEEQMSWPIDPLEKILLETIAHGESAVIADGAYRRALGVDGKRPMTAGELWAALLEDVLFTAPGCDRSLAEALRIILQRGTLATRIVNAIGRDPERSAIEGVYRQMCDCLRTGQMFQS